MNETNSKLFKEGFYLSPKGDTIIQVHSVRWNTHTGLWAIVDFQGSHLEISGGDNSDVLEMLFSSWTILE